MAEHETVFQNVMEHAPISMQLQDRTGLTIRVNDAFLSLFGYESRDQVEGILNVRTNPVILAQGQGSYIERAYAGEYVRSRPVAYRSIKSRQMVVQSTFVPLVDHDGNVKNIVIFHEDVSALTASMTTSEYRTRLLAGLQQAHRGIADRLRVNEVLEAVMDAAQTVIGADKVAIWEIDSEREWNPIAQRGLPANYGAELIAVRRGSPILQDRSVAVAHDALPLIYSLNAPDPRLEEYNAFLKRHRIRNVLTVPMISGRTVSGTLTHYMSAGPEPDPILVETACLLSDQAATALHNARLFEEITAIKDRLEERVRESTSRLEAAHREALANEKLAAVGFLAKEVAHGLRNPLNVVSASAYYLRLRCPTRDEKVDRHFDAITRAIARAADTITDMITLASGSQPTLADVNLNDLVRRAVEDRRPETACPIETNLAADLPIIRGDWTQLHQAVRSLMANAAAARRKEPVRIMTSLDGDMAVVSVGDDRPPMSPEDLANAFGPFSTSATNWTGLGLSVARQILESHKGSARVVTHKGITWFRLEVPVHRVRAAPP